MIRVRQVLLFGFTVLFALPCIVLGEKTEEEPIEVDLEEHTESSLVQVEFTAWPKKGDLSICTELSADDLVIMANGTYPKFRLDRIGYINEALPSEQQNEEPLHLILFYLPQCQKEFLVDGSQYRAFTQSRDFINSPNFKPERDDRIMLVSFARNGLVYHSGWLNQPERILEEIDAVEASLFIPPRRVHDNKFWDALDTLALSVGNTAELQGTKHVVLFAYDLMVDSRSADKLARLAKTLQVNRVQIHTLDLMWDLSPVTIPYGLGTIAWESSGGHLFTNGDTLDSAAEQLSAIYRSGCRFLISFPVRSDWKRFTFVDRISITAPNDKRFRIEAPRHFQNPEKAPSKEEINRAITKRPRWGTGIKLDAGLWNIKPQGDTGRWTSVVQVRIGRIPEEPLPDSVAQEGLRLFVSVNSKRKINKSQAREIVIPPDQLEDFIGSGKPKSLMIPFTVPSGKLFLIAAAGTLDPREAGARIDATYVVPKPPGGGESNSWMLMNGFARVAEHVIPRPALDRRIMNGETASFIGYACPTNEMQQLFGELIVAREAATIQLPIRRLNTYGELASGSMDSCGWFEARTPIDLFAGDYLFKPPTAFRNANDIPGIPFRIVPSCMKP